jgi:protein TonB
MTTHSNNFLKVALAILLLSNSVLIFYIFKQEQNQKNQNSELISLNTKLDFLIKNNSEKQSKKMPYLQVVIEDEKTQELKPVRIQYIENILVDSVEEIEYIEAPREEEEIISCMGFSYREATPEKGMQSFYKYISQNLNYPINAKRKGIEGKVMINFVINKKGEITDVKAKNDIGGGCKEEAERVIRSFPKWNPAKQRGKTVKTRKTIPIIFKLD